VVIIFKLIAGTDMANLDYKEYSEALEKTIQGLLTKIDILQNRLQEAEGNLLLKDFTLTDGVDDGSVPVFLQKQAE
jgi:hypothetical protein